MRSGAVLPLIAAVLPLFLAPAAWAGLAVSPLKQEVSLRPGEQGKVTIGLSNRIRSNSLVAESATITVMDVGVLVGGELDFKAPGTLKNSAAKWIGLNQQKVALEPGKSQAVELTITPPLQTPPGEYYAAVIVTLERRGKAAKGVEVQYEIASGVFVTVLGQTLPKQAKVTKCELNWPDAGAGAEARPARVSVTLANTGPSRFSATGRLRLIDAEKGRVVMTSVLTSPRPCVFGGDSRRFEAPITKLLPAGKYTVKVDMDYESAWSKAYHTATVEISEAQAAQLKVAQERDSATAPAVRILPQKFAQVIPPGGSRSLGVGIRSTTDVPVRCLMTTAPAGETDIESWIKLGVEDVTLPAAAHQSVPVTLEVPAGAKPGKYAATLSVEAWPEGSEVRRIEIPIEIQVKAERN